MSFVDFAAFSFGFDGVRGVPMRLFLVRNWCGEFRSVMSDGSALRLHLHNRRGRIPASLGLKMVTGRLWREAAVDARTLACFGCGWPRVSTVRRFVNLLRRNGLGLLRRQCKLKYCPPRLICTGPQPATVRLDDRPADRQTHPQTGGLGGVEGLENAVRTCGVEARARVPTATSTPPAASVRVLISSSRLSSPRSPIASAAFMIRLRITCCSCTRSPSTDGKPVASSVCSATPCFSTSLRVRAMTSRMASFKSNRLLRGGAF